MSIWCVGSVPGPALSIGSSPIISGVVRVQVGRIPTVPAGVGVPFFAPLWSRLIAVSIAGIAASSIAPSPSRAFLSLLSHTLYSLETSTAQFSGQGSWIPSLLSFSVHFDSELLLSSDLVWNTDIGFPVFCCARMVQLDILLNTTAVAFSQLLPEILSRFTLQESMCFSALHLA